VCRCCFYIWGWIYFNNSSFHISVCGKRSQFSATQFHISSTQCGDQCWILQSKLCYSALWLKNCESKLRFLKKQTAQKVTKMRYNCVNQLVIRDLLKRTNLNPTFDRHHFPLEFHPSSLGLFNICAPAQGLSADYNLAHWFASCENIIWISFKRLYGRLLNPPPPDISLCFSSITVIFRQRKIQIKLVWKHFHQKSFSTATYSFLENLWALHRIM